MHEALSTALTNPRFFFFTTQVSGASGGVTRVLAKKKTQNGDLLTAFEADAVVIAVGVKGAQTLTRLVPGLANTPQRLCR